MGANQIPLHGFALNIAPNLAHFKLINSCGLNRAVTSIAAEIGERTPTIEVVKDRVAEWFVRETARHVEVALHSRNEPY